MRSKRDQLSQALQGQLKSHHRFLLAEQLVDIDTLDEAIERMNAKIAEHLRPYEQQIQRLSTIPGIKRRLAEVILAEIGPDMSRLPSARHLASWAGMVRCITRLNIPGAARKNSKGGSWVNGLPHTERLWGTGACH